MKNLERFTKSIAGTILILVLVSVGDVLSDACSYTRGGATSYVYCEHGCCGSETSRTCCSYEISTSVLVVACVVSGLVVLALIAAIIICCYKNYKDKQQSRVRALRQEQARNAPIRPAEPPKPPSYIESPPEYSEQMPASHYRPRTRMANTFASLSYNTRFGGSQRDSQSAVNSQNTQRTLAIYTTGSSSAYQQVNTSLPGSIDDAPPRYSSLDRGQTPLTNNVNGTNNRHRRFIRTPEADDRNNTTIEEESTISSRNGTESTTTHDTGTTEESRMQTRASRTASRIPQRVQNLQSGRQSSVLSMSSVERSRMTTRSSETSGNNRNTGLADV